VGWAAARGFLLTWRPGGWVTLRPPARHGRGDDDSPWERSFIIAAVVLTALGLALLDGLLQNSAGRVLARAGASAYLFGGVLVVAAEASSVSQGLHKDWSGQNWALAIIYVVLAFLAQAAIGGSLLQAELLPPWIGWATVVWSIGWLLVFVIKRGDIYFPVLPHVVPLVIGVALILQPT
jgi:hypothetical protein